MKFGVCDVCGFPLADGMSSIQSSVALQENYDFPCVVFVVPIHKYWGQGFQSTT